MKRRSPGVRPGVTKRQSSNMITGMARATPRNPAIFRRAAKRRRAREEQGLKFVRERLPQHVEDRLARPGIRPIAATSDG